MKIDIGNRCTNCGRETSELNGGYPSGADAKLTLGWQSYNVDGPTIDVTVDGLLCPDCQEKEALCGDPYCECQEPEGYQLESVGTYIRADGWTYPLLVGGGYDNDEGGAHHISNIDPEDEGYEWWQNLSPEDRKIVEAVKAKGGAR